MGDREAQERRTLGSTEADVHRRHLERADEEVADDVVVDLCHQVAELGLPQLVEDLCTRFGRILGGDGAEDRRARLVLGQERRELDHRVDVPLLRHADLDVRMLRDGLVVELADGVHVLHAETDVEPGVDERAVVGRDEHVVPVSALVDPALRGGTVEVARELGLLDRVAGELHPDVGAPERVPRRAQEEPRHAAAGHCDRSGGVVASRQLLHLGARDVRILEPGGQAGLHLPLPTVALGEQTAGVHQVLVGEREDLGARHGGRDDSVETMSPKTITGAELELDDGPARDAELFLVDGNNLAYRAFFALPEELQTTDGQPTNALLGFTNMLFKLLSDYRPRGVAVAWDTRPVHRTEIAETYKEGRRPMPDLLREQFPHFRPIVEAFGYRNLEFEGWEADDVIATLATHADEAGIKTCVVSTDRDAFQLCSENVTLMMTPRGVADVNVYTPERVELRYGVRPDQVPDFIGLKGDTSDNIPGIPGIGDKTAGQLIAQYGSLEAVIEHADQLSPARGKAVREHADQARESRLLATMRRDLPLDVDTADLVSTAPDRSQLKEIFRRFEFRALLGRVDTLDEALPAADPRLVQDTVAWKESALDTVRGRIGLAWDGERVAIAPADGPVLVSPAGLDDLAVSVRDCEIVTHDAKSLRLAHAPADDTLLAAYLVDPGRAGYELDDLAVEHGIELVPEPAAEETTERLVRHAEAARRLAPILREKVRERGSSRSTTMSSCP